MTLRFLLDTSIISLAQGPLPDHAVAERLAAVGEEAAVASIALHELLYGVAILPSGRKRRNLERFIDTAVRSAFTILPYDEAAATWHAGERARLKAAGQTASFIDGQIAAVAAVNGLIVVTANVRHFRNFEGLSVEDWSTPR